MKQKSNRMTKQRGALRDAIAQAPSLSFLAATMRALPELEWYLVGGGVRDVLLGRGLSGDIDLVARNVPMERLMDALAVHGRVDLVGKSFGVLKFMPPEGGAHVDIALPRTELSRGTGGHRDFEVHADEELTIEDDLSRRDFTVNAMAWDIGKGVLIDPHGGMDDLTAGVIDCVGRPEERFNEDLSRMLRGVRFACQLGFDIAPRTWTAISWLAPRIDERVPVEGAAHSPERLVPYEIVAKEFVKAIAADAPRAVELFEESGLLFRIVPEFEDMARSTMCEDHHAGRTVWTHTKDALTNLFAPGFAAMFPGEHPDFETALAVLFHDVGKPSTRTRDADGHISNHGHDAKGAEMTELIAARLRISSVAGLHVDMQRLAWLVRMHLLPNMVDLDAVRNTTLHKHFLADRARGRRLLHVAYADAMATGPEGATPDLTTLDRLMAKLDALETALEGSAEPKKLLSGADVMRMKGVPAGPDIGRLLTELKEAQLEGRIDTHEDAKRFIEGLE